MPSKYQYKELQLGGWMRLLRLLPSTDDDQMIHVELFIAELGSAPQYETVSYCWGDPNDQAEILCCGQAMNITRSLYSGLKRFRYHQKTRVLWADAICIDQSNDNEKGHQVNMMADIYDRAFAVLVWLGEASALDSEKAFQFIQKINGYVDSKVSESALADNPFMAVVDATGLTERSQLLPNNSELSALHKLFGSPWFDRLWVLQEVALASSAQVLYGPASISFSEIVQFALILDVQPYLRQDLRFQKLSEAFGIVFCTYNKRNSWIQEKPILRYAQDYMQQSIKVSLYEILDAGRGFSATVPHDHIYAFLGHPYARTKDEGVSILKADYKLSVPNLRLQLAEVLLERIHRLDFLCTILHHDLDNIEHHPSWVPRFDEKRIESGSMDSLDWAADNSVDTTGFLKAVVENGKLHGRSLLFDSIATLSDTFKAESFDSMTPTAVEICWGLQADFPSPDDAEERLLEFRQTIVGGLYPGSEVQLPRDFDSYCIEKTAPEFRTRIRPDLSTDQASIGDGDWKHFETWASNSMAEKKFFVTKDGRFGLGPPLLQEGDICCVLIGCRMPLVLRPTSTTCHFKLLGVCYIHNVIFGQLVKDRVKSISDLTEITLV